MARLDRTVAKRIVKKLDAIVRDPVGSFRPLVDADEYKLRVGDYRVLALLSHETTTIIIERVDHRSRVYRAR